MHPTQIAKASWRNFDALKALASRAHTVLATQSPLGTGKLVLAILPEASEDEYKALSSMLHTAAQRIPAFAACRQKTGKKTRFGKEAVEWVRSDAPIEATTASHSAEYHESEEDVWAGKYSGDEARAEVAAKDAKVSIREYELRVKELTKQETY